MDPAAVVALPVPFQVHGRDAEFRSLGTVISVEREECAEPHLHSKYVLAILWIDGNRWVSTIFEWNVFTSFLNRIKKLVKYLVIWKCLKTIWWNCGTCTQFPVWRRSTTKNVLFTLSIEYIFVKIFSAASRAKWKCWWSGLSGRQSSPSEDHTTSTGRRKKKLRRHKSCVICIKRHQMNR